MEDSIELPYSDEEPNEINFFVSPQNSNTKDPKTLVHTASQESLAYSNCKDRFMQLLIVLD